MTMTHREILTLLPWYLNKTLTDLEYQEVAGHLADCTDCRQEIESLKALQQHIVEQNEAAPTPSPRLLTNIFERIEQDAATPARSEKMGWTDRFQQWIGEIIASVRQPFPQAAYAMIAAEFILIVGLVGMLWTEPKDLRTLSGPVPQIETRARLTVAFHPDATELQIRNILKKIDGAIVSGPSALGLYRVELKVSPHQTMEIEKRVKLLREYPDVIRFAGI